jgi:transcriptional regulator with XRE-family HTH domain
MTPTRPSDRALRWLTTVDGQQLRRLRLQRGLGREELAGLAGISLVTVAKIEREHQARCQTRTLARLAAALGEHPATMIAVTPLDG